MLSKAKKPTKAKYHYVLEMPFERYFAIDEFLTKYWSKIIMGSGTNLITGKSDIHLYSDKPTAHLAIMAIRSKFGSRSIKFKSYTEEEWENGKID